MSREVGPGAKRWGETVGFGSHLQGNYRRESSCLLIVAVVVDEAAIRDDLALSLGQRTGGDRELGDGAVRLDSVSREACLVLQNSLADARDKDVVAQLEDSGFSTRKGVMPQLMQLER